MLTNYSVTEVETAGQTGIRDLDKLFMCCSVMVSIVPHPASIFRFLKTGTSVYVGFETSI